MPLLGNPEVVTFHLDLHAQSAERIGDDAKVFHGNILDADALAAHRCHTDKRAHLDHIGQDLVLSAVQFLHALNRQQIRGDAADLGTHTVQQMAELLQVGLTGCVVDSGRALGEDGCHHDVGRTGHGCLVEQHIGAFQSGGGNLVDVASLDAVERRTEFLESEEVGVQSSAAYLVAAGLGDHGLAHTCQQRTDHQHTASQFGAFPDELVALQIV